MSGTNEEPHAIGFEVKGRKYGSHPKSVMGVEPLWML
jgi:hypothetical protein